MLIHFHQACCKLLYVLLLHHPFQNLYILHLAFPFDPLFHRTYGFRPAVFQFGADKKEVEFVLDLTTEAELTCPFLFTQALIASCFQADGENTSLELGDQAPLKSRQICIDKCSRFIIIKYLDESPKFGFGSVGFRINTESSHSLDLILSDAVFNRIKFIMHIKKMNPPPSLAIKIFP